MDVLIVGAGPTGLTAALVLGRCGVDVRIIDAGGGPSVDSKALGVQSRTLEILRPTGVAGDMVEQGRKLIGARLHVQGREIGG